MARAIWLPGGGGADLDVVTADAGDVLAGKVIVGPDGEPLTGTLALSGNASDGQVLSGQTYYNTDAKTKRTGTMPNRGAVNQSLAINGSYTIPAGFHNGSGKVTQSVKTKGAQTYTPGTTNQTIAAGQYLTGAQTIKGDPNLRPENIKKGVSIMGIIGTWEEIVSNPYYLWNRGSFKNGQSITGGQISGAYIRANNTYFNNLVDLTNHKYLKFVVQADQTRGDQLDALRIYITTATNQNIISEEKRVSLGTKIGTVFVDIASLKGSYKIWLESGYDISGNTKYAVNTDYYEVYLSNQ